MLLHLKPKAVVAFFCALSLMFMRASTAELKRLPPQAHGTVNIIIANQNGLVALTDSRLSYDGRARNPVSYDPRFPDEGQKLFQIDDHTLCTIAGLYSAAGPTEDGVHYPAYSALPNLIRYMIASNILSSLPLEQKVDRIENFVVFTLNLVQSIADIAGDKSQTPLSEITLATFESGRLRIAAVRLTLDRSTGQAIYRETDRQFVDVGKSVTYVVRGIPNVAEPFLSRPGDHNPTDPILDYYKHSISEDGGQSLSVKDMTQVARQLENATANHFSHSVGGYAQVATLVEGKVTLTEPFPLHFPFDKLSPSLLYAFSENVVTNGGIGVVGRNRAVLAVHDKFMNVPSQKLDNILFFDSDFENVSFVYDGSSVSFFDASNRLVHCSLKVSKNVPVSSLLIAHIRQNFPTLLISKAP